MGARSKAAVAAGLLATATALAAALPEQRFDAVFTTAGEPATLHFRATYVTHGVPHTLEVWRAGDRRVKRVTDGGIVVVATHAPATPKFRMTVVDARKRVVTTIDRTNLYRLGNFTDWFDLTHGLRHPKAAYRLTTATAPRGIAAVAGCAWYDLTVDATATHICWSRGDRVPLLIVAADGAPVWRVEAIDRRPFGADTFRVADRGFVRVDANRDLDRD